MLGLTEAMVLADASDAPLLPSKAADFLKSSRDSGADDIPVGPVDDRLASAAAASTWSWWPDRPTAPLRPGTCGAARLERHGR